MKGTGKRKKGRRKRNRRKIERHLQLPPPENAANQSSSQGEKELNMTLFSTRTHTLR